MLGANAVFFRLLEYSERASNDKTQRRISIIVCSHARRGLEEMKLLILHPVACNSSVKPSSVSQTVILLFTLDLKRSHRYRERVEH